MEDAKIKKIQRKYKNNLKWNSYYINNKINNTKLGAAFGRPPKGGAAAFGRRPPFGVQVLYYFLYYLCNSCSILDYFAFSLYFLYFCIFAFQPGQAKASARGLAVFFCSELFSFLGRYLSRTMVNKI